MAVSGISTLALFKGTLRDVSGTFARLADLQNQLSSGRRGNTFESIAERTGEFKDVESRLARNEQFITNNTITVSRLETTSTALNQIISVANEIKSLITSRRTEIANIDFDLQLRGQWSVLVSTLNSTNNGQYIFSGTATDRQAVVDPDELPALDANGAVDLSYFGGEAQDITTRIEPNVSLTTNVRADNPAIQKILQGIAVAAEANIQDSDVDLARAYELIDQGLQGVITVQSSVNANKVRTEEASLTLSSSKVYLSNLKAEIGDVDILSVSSQISVDQAVLQATFQAFSIINSLRLVDFLR